MNDQPRPRSRWTMATRVVVMGVLQALLITGLFALLLSAIDAQHDAERRVSAAEAALASALVIEQGVADAQAAIGVFVMARRPEALARYVRARRSIENETARFLRLTAATPADVGPPREIVVQIETYFERYAEPVVATTRRSPRRAARLLVGNGGAEFLGDVREALAAYADVEREHIATERADADRAADRAIAFAIGGLAGLLALIAMLCVYFIRVAVRPTRRAAEAAARVGSGDLAVRLEDEGPPETAELGRAFNAMTVSLAEARGTLEQRNAELGDRGRSLQRALELNRAVLASTYDAFVSMDVEGLITAWNVQAQRLFGWHREEVLGRELAATIIPESLRDHHRRGLERFKRTGEGRVVRRRVEMHGLHRDGYEFPVELTVTPVRTGEDWSFHAFVRDITDRRLAEARGRARQEAVAALAHAPDVSEALAGVAHALGDALGCRFVAVWLEETETERLEPAALWHVREVDPSDVGELSPEHRLSRGVGLPGRVCESGETVVVTNVASELPEPEPLLRQELYEGIAVPMRSGSETFGAVVLFGPGLGTPDDDLRTVLEQIGTRLGEYLERRRAEAEADRAKDEFLGLVSHELRTPLTSIAGYLELLLDYEAVFTPEQQRAYLEVVDRNTRRLLRLVGELLFAAQLEAGRLRLNPEPIDLAQAAADTVALLRAHAADRGVELMLDAEPVPGLHADPDKVSQLLDNLVTNAVKFTPSGGRVRVTVRPDAGAGLLEVSDTGIGIPEDERQRLFDRFYRASTAIKHGIQGVGLGLSIVKAIVDAHGGSIEIDSEVGEGTTVAVRLPYLEPDAGVSPRDAGASQRTQRARAA